MFSKFFHELYIGINRYIGVLINMKITKIKRKKPRALFMQSYYYNFAVSL